MKTMRRISVLASLICVLLGCNQISSGLSKDKVQKAMNTWMLQFSHPPTVEIQGIHEIPAEEKATVTLQFSDLYTNGPAWGSSQVVYKGPAEATFIHYSDGRWVLDHIELHYDSSYGGRFGWANIGYHNLNIEAQ